MKFTGVMPALVTPLTAEGRLNKEVLEKLMEDLLTQGADGFYIGGATGEGIIIDKEVHKELAAEAVRIAAGRVPCIIHVARMNYGEMLELARNAAKAGAAAVSAIPPLFYDYSREDIYRYYEGLAKAADIPVMIYNNPDTGVRFTAEQVAELFNIKNVTAIKWTNTEYNQVVRIKQLTGGRFNVINGPDDNLLCGLAAGVDGCIGTTYNFMLPTIRKIYDSFHAGDLELARSEQAKVCAVAEVLAQYNCILATKVIMEAKGYDLCYPLYPVNDYTNKEKDEMLARFKAAGLEI